MTNLSFFANDSPVPESTLVELFFDALDRHRGRAAFQRMESETALADISYEDTLQVVKRVAAALPPAPAPPRADRRQPRGRVHAGCGR